MSTETAGPGVGEPRLPGAILLNPRAIDSSPTNPRKALDQAELDELTESVRRHGVLEPVLVRPKGNRYELVFGERRYRAAKAAALESLPAVVRELTDAEVLEIQLVENLRRTDLHPLEEADGYQRLMKQGYDVGKVAERVGRSPKYVYDRVKLLSLTPKAQELFAAGNFTAGHAILLARLKPEQQKKALEADDALFERERLLWNPEYEARHGRMKEHLKARSVRELAGWIDEHVRFDARDVDQMVFPETVASLAAALEGPEKIVPITYEHFIPPEAREGRTWGPRSWKRADGKRGSKTCQSSITGVVAVGPERGEAFRVCTEKEKCKVHWSAEQREKKKRAAAAAKGTASQEAQRWKREEQKREAARLQEQEERKRWEKARPAVLEAIAARVKKAPAAAGGLLAEILLAELRPRGGSDAKSYVPRGSSAEDLVRHAAFLVLFNEAHEFMASRAFPKRAKAFGIDVKKILESAAPAAPPPKAERA